MVHIKDPLLLIRRSSQCSGSSRFPLSLSEWSFTISPITYNHIKNVLSASLNQTFLSFIHSFLPYTHTNIVKVTNINGTYLAMLDFVILPSVILDSSPMLTSEVLSMGEVSSGESQ